MKRTIVFVIYKVYVFKVMVMSYNMRSYLLKKLLPVQRILERLSAIIVSFRLVVLIMTMLGGGLLNLSVHADDHVAAQQIDLSLERSLSTTVQPKSDIEVLNRPLIAGLWGMKIPNANCTEYYNFKENGDFFVKSSGERSIGKYVYQLPEMAAMAKNLPQLTLGVLYDNNDVDCSGNKINQTGEVHQEYVKWISASRIKFCETVDGMKCQLELDKVLP